MNEKKVVQSEKDFRIAESLFESRDAKALVGHQVLEFEALSNDPIIIIIDLPGIDNNLGFVTASPSNAVWQRV